MPIRVECSACRATFSVRDDAAGRRGKCPKCQSPIQVPAARPEPAATPRVADSDDSEAYLLAGQTPKVRAVLGQGAGNGTDLRAKVAAPTRPSQSRAQILAAFRAEIEPVRPTSLYRLWIAIVAATMVVLPIVYVALVMLVIAALAWHAVFNVAILTTVKSTKAASLLYLGPLLAGGMVVAFMVKPLFARPGKQPKTRALDPSHEPLVFAFVDGVCGSVGAPRPSRIDVSCEVNASAHRDAGPLAIFNNDLVLTIGLPLVAGMSLEEFAGVLAHEFGHFSQGAGMRLSTLIRTINGWFARLVYQRDEWDERLVAWSTSGNQYAMGIALLARVTVWLTRRVLWALMMFGHVVSGFLMREMEFDADRYAARMVGGEVFEAMMRRVFELDLAARGAFADLVSSWQERRLPDNLPKLILANVDQIPGEVLQPLEEARLASRTGLFDTHPADKDRIARALLEDPEGIFALEGPATDLFPFFDSLCKVATLEHYRTMIGPEISKDQLYPVADAVHGQAAIAEARQAFDRIFLEGHHPLAALPLPEDYPALPGDLKAAKRVLVEARGQMARTLDDHLTNRAKREERHGQAVAAESAVALLRAGNRIKASEYGLESAKLDEAEAAARAAVRGFLKLTEQPDPFESAAARRLVAALALLESETVAGRVSEGEDRRTEAHALYPCAAYITNRIAAVLHPSILAREVVVSLAEKITQGRTPHHPKLNEAIVRAGGILHKRLNDLHTKLDRSVAYPFDHAEWDMTIAKFALPRVPPEEALGDLVMASGAAIENLDGLSRRVLGRLAVTVEEVERALGLSPLEVGASPAAGPANPS